MNTCGNDLSGQVEIHLLDLLVGNLEGYGKVDDGERLGQLDLDPVYAKRLVVFLFV